ncbi:hypothetical protein WA538_001429 [Blastocystis sp. DL]
MDKSGTKENDSVDQSKDTTIVEVQSPVAQSSHNTIAKDVSPDESSGISLFQFSVALIKSTTGPGVLAIPYAINNMGIVMTVILFSLIAAMNIYCSFLLIDVMHYTKKNKSKYLPRPIGNKYSAIIYHVFGNVGYTIFQILYLFSIWGVLVSVLISIVDFLTHLPWPESFLGGEANQKVLFHIVSTILAWILVLMSSLKPLMFVSSFSIFALLFSFVVLLIYGYSTYGAHVDSSVLGPRSLTALFSSMGVPAFSLGYNFSFLTFYTALKPSTLGKAGITNILSISGAALFLMAMPMAAYFSYRGSPDGMAQNVLVSIPKEQLASTVITAFMFLSCLFTYPIVTPPLNEIIEGNYKNTSEKWYFVTDAKRVGIRSLQTLVVSLVAFFFPYFEKIISLDIL